jgi:hypothetical protein
VEGGILVVLVYFQQQSKKSKVLVNPGIAKDGL